MPKRRQSLGRKLYAVCYLLGVFLLRGTQKLWHRNRISFARLRLRLRRCNRRVALRLDGMWQKFCILVYEFTDPFSHVVSDAFSLASRLRHAARRKAEPTEPSVRILVSKLLHSMFAALCSLFNHLMPIVAAVALLFVIGRASARDWAIEVRYQGKVLGYVNDELVFQNAKQLVQERAVFDRLTLSGSLKLSAQAETASETQSKQQLKNLSATFALIPVDAVVRDDADSLCNKLIRSLKNISQADGLYVDGTFYGAVSQSGALAKTLNGMLDKADTGTGTVSFYRDVTIKEGLYPKTSLVSINELETLLQSKVQGKKEYIIQEGDTPIGIAQKAGISLAELRTMNPKIETTCFVGQAVTLAQEKPFLPVMLTRQETYEVAVPYDTQTKESSAYYVTQSFTVRQGNQGTDRVTAKVSYVEGKEVNREIIATKRLKDPVTRVVTKGTKQLPTAGYLVGANGLSFIWPTRSKAVSCGFRGYWGHNGMDIMGGFGDPIYAAEDGVVTAAGWNPTGYGYLVEISHGNGVVTRYGHNQRVLVRVGQRVTQGQLVAEMGDTGWATGPHCHFEVRIYDTPYNPAYYLPPQ